MVNTRQTSTLGRSIERLLLLFHLSLPPVLGFTRAALPLGLRTSSQEMLVTRTEYDRDVNTFSAEGRLFQVEYAMKLRSTAIALKTKECVVLAVDELLDECGPIGSVLYPAWKPSRLEKVMEIGGRIRCAE
ncbi:hypothetical protein MUK42_16359 [Musa troglodytarum]|uniref:Proteasome alpha-type subunits domain-containing protein n=1 Tax=Musa troglodytarum TaxID=320322 RepID=A0A9E7H971_9LILI|nr:hypothetical protein MUK42_16359 [Musa troglodytarum]URE29071.1 hypothetical protein MUK42_16359 [Musa troglodytarum]